MTDPSLDPTFVAHRLRFAGLCATPAAIYRRICAEVMRRFYARNYYAGQLARAERAGDAATAARLREQLDAVGPAVPTEKLPRLPLP
jgi:hypothetical protein